VKEPHLHTCCTGRAQPPDVRPLHRAYLLRACKNGREPLEVLAAEGMHDDRDALLCEWVRRGWTPAQIAQHTRSTTYTVGRLLDRIGVSEAHSPAKGAA
jgi:hypothetical protein